MRRSLILLLLVCVGYGAAVYHLKFAVGQLESSLSHTQRQIIAEKEAIHILRAEMAYITRPEQIAQMAAKHLDLSPIAVTQINQLADWVPDVAYSDWANAEGDPSAPVLVAGDDVASGNAVAVAYEMQ